MSEQKKQTEQADGAQGERETLESILDDVCGKQGGLPIDTPIYNISLDEIAEAFTRWQEARCALAQPSPAPELVDCRVCGGAEYSMEGGDCKACNGSGKIRKQARAALAQPSPAPELERPEVVAYQAVGAEAEPCLSFREDFFGYTVYGKEPLMAVAQHDRIVGALRTENSILRSGMRGDFDLDAWLQWAAERQSAPVAQAGQVPTKPTPQMMMAALAAFRMDVPPNQAMEAALIAALAAAPAQGGE